MRTSEHGTLLLFLVFVLSYYVCTVYTHNRTQVLAKSSLNTLLFILQLPINYKELILSIIKLTHIIQ